MAKGKGKSRRRIKDWHQRYDAGDQLADESAARQRLGRREVKLPPWRIPEENLQDLPKAEGMVIGLFPGGALVRIQEADLLCGLAGTFRPPAESSALAVGDIVTVAMGQSTPAEQGAEADKDRADGMILSRQARRTALSRPQGRSGKRNFGETFEKVIAANMDVLLIVASTAQPPLRRGLIDRFLIIAERGEMECVLVINKTDLAAPDGDTVAELQGLLGSVVCCSCKTGEGLDALAAALKGRKSVLAGASGTGKSTLINCLVPGAGAATRTIRTKDNRGRHRTSAAAVYQLPAGGLLVDTPGVRELGIRLEAAELPWYFPEFTELSGQCKFRNCTHTHEPDCAVIQAVQAGELSPRRYESYLRIHETLRT